MKPGVKIALGIFTSLAAAGFILVYDFYIKDRIDSQEVVIVKPGEEISKSEKIHQNKLTVERRAKESLLEGVVLAEDIDKVIGHDANQLIVGNSMLSTKMIDFDLLVPDATKGEAIRPITDSMIFAQPGSLRRKDVVDIYLVYKDGSTNMTENGPNTVSSEEPSEDENSVSTKGEKVNTKVFLKGVKVVYVKDSGNKEVVSASDNGKSDDRLNASSTISDLEVILNEEDFSNLMYEVLQKEARLYITY
ncbi:hypothetical protein D1B31_17890 [Neobacillus notoginsengisoli]|uniref:SAF domain-containing protein n=1 Tax=Neobacillus notoginsengisoli TaxID=1578198 RepID=A0A417YQA2_9BACI|nr:hypothetical protein [Neobacillus notoginsengisoli]RHW35963.1 hypothetical protein D1B31_17890 [Neobacillus notoginsengisoli]